MDTAVRPKSPPRDAGTAQVASPGTFVGLFLVTLSTLACQTLLTRIFSVTLAYHFAFLAVSIGMLGMTWGISAAFWVGFGSYVAATLGVFRAIRS